MPGKKEHLPHFLATFLLVNIVSGIFLFTPLKRIEASSSTWTQTSAGDFGAGTADYTDITSSAGDVLLSNISWWNDNYLYAKKLTVTTGARSVTSGYSASITSLDTSALVTDAKMRSDGNDLRVLHWNGLGWTELDREVTDMNTTSTSIWFKLQSDIDANASDDNYYLFYGYPGESSSPPVNKADIYAFWDDFSGGSIDATKWTTLGRVSQSGGVLAIGTSTPSAAYGTTPFSGAVLEAAMKWSSTSSAPYAYGGLSNTAVNHFLLWHQNSWKIYAYNNTDTDKSFTSVITDPLNFHTYKIQWDPAILATYSIDNATSIASHTTSVPGIDLLPFFQVAVTAGNTLYLDEVKVRKYVNPEPAVSLGAELTALGVYDDQGTFISAAFDSGGPSTFDSITWSGSTPTNTTLKFQIRTGLTQALLASSTWSGPTGSTDYYTVSGTAINSDNSPSRWIQYKLFLTTTNQAATPSLSSISVHYTTGISPPVAAKPILVLTDSSNNSNALNAYVKEILDAEGEMGYQAIDISLYDPSLISASYLGGFDTVILADTAALPANIVSALTSYVYNGGNLIGLRPDTQLAAVFGLTSLGTTTSEQYLAIDSTTAIGSGVTSTSMQFHGEADNYGLNGASAIATIYSDATTPTTKPAVTLASYGSGRAVAFTFDLARSTVLFHQGNIANSTGDPDADGQYRPQDLFYNYLDTTKADIPQADQQQALFLNAIRNLSSLKKPLPRLWYYPNKAMSLTWITGDGDMASAAQTQAYATTTELYGGYFTYFEGMDNTFNTSLNTSLQAAGHSIAKHVDLGCAKPTLAQMQSYIPSQLQSFKSAYGHQPLTDRQHCLNWVGWTEQADVLAANGVRINSNFTSILGNSGDKSYINGSGLPMKFMDSSGKLIDLYEQSTTFYEEHNAPIVDQSFDNYHSVLTYSFHPVNANIPLVSSAAAYSQSKGIPMISGDTWADFVDARREVEFRSIASNSNTISFDIAQGDRTIDNATIMMPATWGSEPISGITESGASKAYTTSTIFGADYALFNVSMSASKTKSYTVRYSLSGSSDFGPSSPINDAGTSDIPQFSWNAYNSGVGFSKYQLYLDNSLKDDNIGSSATSIRSSNALSCGSHSWYLRAVDGEGNTLTSPSASFSVNCGGSASHEAYTPPATPIGSASNGDFRISINDNATTTVRKDVVLKLYAGAETTDVAISNTPDFKIANMRKYAATTPWDICTGTALKPSDGCLDGEHTVYIKFYDRGRLLLPEASSSIVLREAPDAESATLAPSVDPNVKTPQITLSMRYGSNGYQVVLLQNRLKQLGFFPKNIRSNGNFGPATLAAVKALQVKNKVVKPGEAGYGWVGPKTKKVLNAP